MGNIPRVRVFFVEVSTYDVKLTLQHHMKINSYTILYLVNSTAYPLGVAEKVSCARNGRAKDAFFTILRCESITVQNSSKANILIFFLQRPQMCRKDFQK